MTAEDREFWRGVLSGSRYTPVPRWSRGTGTPAVLRAPLPQETAEALEREAGRRELSPDTLLLAAYVKVLTVLTGDPTVVAGCLPDRLPLAVTVADGTWSGLVAETARTTAAARSHGPHALDALRAEGADTGPLFDAVWVDGRAPQPQDLDASTVLAVGLDRGTDVWELGLAHRPDVHDTAHASRVAGYVLAALHTLATGPDSAHHEWSPLSPDEAAEQLAAMAGPHRDLPALRVHQLVEEQARKRPDAVAAVHDGESWTYRELDEHANRVAHALRRTGLRDEGVVAVVTERNLHWPAAVLGVLKAGGVYLPVEPHFPADRIADMLRRSDCRHVLTDDGASPHLDEALRSLDGLRTDDIATLLAGDDPVTDPGVAVAADQPAYIYFTSGSTGAPKGAMCEHAGFLNHLLAKIEDLDIGEGRVVAQTAPQCFDISLWQLLAALAVGGRTLVVGQQDILDSARFVDLLEAAGVEVFQAVPSYLEVLLTELERNPRALPRLRHVSVTGEALKKELVERWFGVFPQVALVNAYGLTETSDDTNHAVLRGVPDQPSVPLGRAVANVRIHVVDERLRLVPLGSPGEIAFSGVCVGRGYVNDPERTGAAFVSDPYDPGRRLYRSGDFGRWLPDGNLEFLGRRDAQVKIRGFRIEIGEVENRLLGIPGVRDSAVVVTGEGDGRRLAAFCTGYPDTPEALRQALAEKLPAYLMPGDLYIVESLPLTGNGKTDRKALTRLAEADGAADAAGAAPRTDTERRLAALWAEEFKVPVERISRSSRFFDSGGTSLSLLRLAIALDRLLTPAELKSHPVLADCAALLDRKAAEAVPERPAESTDSAVPADSADSRRAVS
ncbi:non-ribosomal peptide synthetase [Streptomyces sp. NPDC002004]